MLEYFIRSIFDLTDEEDNIIYFELINNKKINDILLKKEIPISFKDYDKCLKLINKIKNIIYEEEYKK